MSNQHTNNSPLSVNKMSAWLRATPGRKFFDGMHCCSCPIATYLRESGLPNAIVGLEHYNNLTPVSGSPVSNRVEMPGWAKRLRYSIDHCPMRYDLEAHHVLRMLNQIQRNRRVTV